MWHISGWEILFEHEYRVLASPTSGLNAENCWPTLILIAIALDLIHERIDRDSFPKGRH